MQARPPFGLHVRAASGYIAFIALGFARLAAQTPSQAPDASNDEAVKMNTYVVTGSNIPTAADATDVPVAILGKHDIDTSGIINDALEVLHKTIPAFTGRSDTGAANGSNNNQTTGGGSSVFLRNLPTLILVNGRRVTYSSINGSGGKNFVDISMFPVAAIDH